MIVMTVYGGIEDAVTAMKQGALDFLAKPLDPDHLLLLVNRALAQRRLVTENMLLKRGAGHSARRAADHRRRWRALKKVDSAAQRAAGRRDGAAPRRERNGQGARRARDPR